MISPIRQLPKKIVSYIKTKRYLARARKDRGNQWKELARLESSYQKYHPLLVHIGCGPRVLKGWVNIDLSYAYTQNNKAGNVEPHPEEDNRDRSDFFALNVLETGLPFPDNSVDAIFHEDFIEHLDQKEQFIFLAEMFRVLKPGSVHRVNTPDLLASMKTNSDFKKGKNGVYVSEWDKWGHKSILFPAYLREIATVIGYSQVIFNGKDLSISKLMPKEYRPGVGRGEKGNLFADLIK